MESDAITVSISKLTDHRVGSTVKIHGWAETIRVYKRHSFIELRDGVGSIHHIQVIVPGTLSPDVTTEAYLEITGVIKELPSKAYSYQPFELQAIKLTVLSKSEVDFPSRCPPDASAEVKLQERHLYLRDPRFALYTKARAIFMKALRKAFEKMDMTEIDPPCFVGTQCEGGATLFKLKHPGRTSEDIPAYLTQSSQFYLEYALPAIGDCFCITHSFRAEHSHTRRHLTEFLHAECEWAKIFKFEDHLDRLRRLLKLTIDYFLDYCGKYEDVLTQLDLLSGIKEPSKDTGSAPTGLLARVRKLRAMCDDIQILTHKDAIKYCREHEIYKDPETKTHFGDRDDIPEARERELIDQIGKIVFLVKFPREFKSFYMALDPEDPTYVLGVDVEVPGVGEVIGSGVRVSDVDTLKIRMKEEGLKEEDYKEYIDLRRYGHGKTSGMGMGVDRMLTWLLDLHSIREIVTFPRYPGHLFP